jgi:hypothetical protein
MLKFLRAVAFGAVVYTASFAITDGVFIPIAGIFFSLFVAGVFVLPLRALLRFCMPQATQQTRAIVATIILLGLVVFAMVMISPTHLPQGRLGFLVFWAIYIITLVVSLFWPFTAQTSGQEGCDARDVEARAPKA